MAALYAFGMAIRIGTSGWNYPSGKGTWNGVFYPARRPRGFDELAYYAEHFDTVEVNSSFYRVPEPALTSKWIARTPDDFQFSIKLYQKFTHPDMFLKRAGTGEWDVTRADVDLFKLGIDPVVAAGRLGALLMQFPASFQSGPDERAYVEWLLEMFAGYPIAVELRHKSWSEERAATLELVRAGHAVWAYIDEPQFAGSVDRPLVPAGDASTDLVYVRLHGRNTGAWWTHDESEDRYNYLYTRDELAPIARAVQTANTPGRRTIVHFNNHFSAKAVANAAELRHLLGDLVPGEYMPEMTRRYPALDGIVRVPGLPI